MARTIPDLAEIQRLRSDVAWERLVALTLYRDRFADTSASLPLLLSDATRYRPKATILDDLSVAGPLLGDWITPAGWDGLAVVGGRLRATALDATEGGNLQDTNAVEAFAAVTLTTFGGWVDAATRSAGVFLCASDDGDDRIRCLVEYDGSGGGYFTTIDKYVGGVFSAMLVTVPTGATAWPGQRLYAATRLVAGGLEITVRLGSAAGPIMAQAVDASPLSSTDAGPEIFLSSGGGALSDIELTAPCAGPARVEYLGIVTSWGAVGDALEAINPTFAPSSMDLVLSNVSPLAAGGVTADRFSDLLREGDNTTGFDKAEGDLECTWLPPGGIVGVDDVVLYRGKVDTFEAADLR